METFRKIMVALIIILFLGIVSGTAIAGSPPPVPTKPTPTPPPQTSGGYSPSSYSSPPTFQPYTEELKSSKGITTGNLTGIDYSTVRLTASGSATIDGDIFSLVVGADMNSKPDGASFDIKMGGDGNLPGGMDNVVVLSTASIIAQSRYGWSIKSGTPTIKFTMPASRLDGASPDSKYYLVCYDGTGYQIITVNVVTGNGTATIEARVPGISGTFTTVMSCPPKPVVASLSTTLPAQVSIMVPCPTPAPVSTGILGHPSSIWVSAFGTFTIGEVAGAVILFGLGRFIR